MLAAETLRELARQNHKQASLTPLRLADFLAQVHEHERVLLQRLKDLEAKAVRDQLPAGLRESSVAPDSLPVSSLDEGAMIRAKVHATYGHERDADRDEEKGDRESTHRGLRSRG